MNPRWIWPGLISILLLSAAVRLHDSADMPLWTDEGWTTWAIHNHQPTTIIDNLEDERHPPLYFLVLSAWWSLIGPDRLILRLVSIAAGLLATATIIRIARDWLDDESAIFAGLLFAVLNSAVYYTQEVRPYSWMILAGTLTSLFFLRYLRSSQRCWLVYYTLSLIFNLYVGYFGLLLVGLQGIFFIRAASWRQRRGLLVAWSAALIAFLPWIPSMTRQFNLILADDGIRDYPGSFNTTFDHSVTMMRTLFNEQFILLIPLYMVGIAALYRQKSRRIAHYLVGASTGILLFMMLVNLQIGVVSARTLSLLLPYFAIIVSYGLRSLPSGERRPGVVLLAISFLLIPQDVQPRLDSITAVEALAENLMPGDLVILETGADDNAFWYELQLLDTDIDVIRTRPWTKIRGSPDGPQQVIPQIENQLTKHDRIWIIQWLQVTQVRPHLNRNTEYRRIFNSEHSVGDSYIGRFDDDTIQLTMFERPVLFEMPLNFGDKFQLSGAVVPETFEAGETLHLDLWWSPLATLVGRYRISYSFRRRGGQFDVQETFSIGIIPYADWVDGELYFGRNSIIIPPDIEPDTYRIRMSIFSWEQGQFLQVNGRNVVIIGRVTIE